MFFYIPFVYFDYFLLFELIVFFIKISFALLRYINCTIKLRCILYHLDCQLKSSGISFAEVVACFFHPVFQGFLLFELLQPKLSRSYFAKRLLLFYSSESRYSFLWKRDILRVLRKGETTFDLAYVAYVQLLESEDTFIMSIYFNFAILSLIKNI